MPYIYLSGVIVMVLLCLWIYNRAYIIPRIIMSLILGIFSWVGVAGVLIAFIIAIIEDENKTRR
jgi:hypothetical protein